MDGNGLAVLVFIHGGAYYGGSGSTEMYGPEYFMDQDVVLVTFNYRLAMLGKVL
jgi:carboxylesterase type B